MSRTGCGSHTRWVAPFFVPGHLCSASSAPGRVHQPSVIWSCRMCVTSPGLWPASTYGGNREMSARKQDIRSLTDASAPERRKWLARAAFFHQEDLRYLKFLIPEGARVLELGCGTGDLLAALKPSFGVGVDFSAGMIGEARKAY